MSRAYSDPKRAGDPHALPDARTDDCQFRSCHLYSKANVHIPCVRHTIDPSTDDREQAFCDTTWCHKFIPCLPDGDPNGPFATEAEALADAQEGSDDE